MIQPRTHNDDDLRTVLLTASAPPDGRWQAEPTVTTAIATARCVHTPTNHYCTRKMATRNPLLPVSAPPLPLSRYSVSMPAVEPVSRKKDADVPGPGWTALESVPGANAMGATG